MMMWRWLTKKKLFFAVSCLIIFFVAVIFFAPNLLKMALFDYGVTVTANSGSARDIQSAIDGLNSVHGTVFIPAGTWNFVEVGEPWVTVNVPPGVNIFGAGYSGVGAEIDAQGNNLNIPTTWETVLIMPYDVSGTWGSPAVWFNLGCGGANFPPFELLRADYSKTIRVSGLKLEGYRSINPSSTTMHKGFVIYGLNNYRIDHCSIENCAGGGVEIPCYGGENYYTSGVIDHCRIYNTAGYDVLANYGSGNIGYGVNVQRQAYGSSLDMWKDTNEVMGQYTNGTTVIENCYLSRWRHVVASGNNGYYVFRYNYVSGDMGHFSMDVHGLRDAEVGRLGGRGAEVYENRFINATIYPGSEGYSGGLFQFGGGCGAWFNNFVDSTYLYASLYNEDAVSSSLCHVQDFYLWSKTGTWSGSVSNAVVDPVNRHVGVDWSRVAGVYGAVGYPNINPSWSISWYRPYPYPFQFDYETVIPSISPTPTSTYPSPSVTLTPTPTPTSSPSSTVFPTPFSGESFRIPIISDLIDSIINALKGWFEQIWA